MATISRRAIGLHNQACELLTKNSLTFSKKLFILENWNEAINNNHQRLGAFFTPLDMARECYIEMNSPVPTIDLCAGIGAFSFQLYNNLELMDKAYLLTCVEINPVFIEVGKKLLPKANWVLGDATDIEFINSLGDFSQVISNPPFGDIKTGGVFSGDYSGNSFEYKIIEVGKHIGAKYGTFLIPQSSSSFKLSGQQCFEEQNPTEYVKFNNETGIELLPNCGIDLDFFRNSWKHTNILCECNTVDYRDI